jgi:flagellar protein FliS
MKQNLFAQDAAGAYRKTATVVAPLTAVILLYDKVIVLLQRASLAAEAKQPQESFIKVTEATMILRGLSHALDFERGGRVAERLRTMYTQTILALLSSYGKPDMPARYRRIGEGLSGLRAAWVEVARQAQVTDGTGTARGV